MQPLTERFNTAMVLASRLHENQTRKSDGGRIPYVSHLLRVAGLVLEYGGDEDTAIAALLHDAVEDQGGMETAAYIRRMFGDAVAEMVMECSDSVAGNGEKKLPWRQRKEAYLAHLRVATPGAALISACDKLDNMASMTRNLRMEGPDFLGKFAGGKDGTLWYYTQIVEVLTDRHSPVAEELAAAFARMVNVMAELE